MLINPSFLITFANIRQILNATNFFLLKLLKIFGNAKLFYKPVKNVCFLRFFLVFKQKNTIFAYGIETFSKVHYIYI